MSALGTGPAAWAAHSPITDPGRHAPLLDAVPADPSEVCRVVAGHVSHYVASGLSFSRERRAELDLRGVEDMLGAILERDPAPLDVPRAPEQRLVGCCRDLTVLAVAALRHHGVPARSRVGFAGYLGEGFWYDHVVLEHFDGVRWVRADPQLPPVHAGLDMRDLDPGAFRTAAQVWLDHRAGRIDEEQILDFGAGPELPFAGAYYVRSYVLLELAHLAGVETLLWDTWGAMLTRPLRRSDDHGLVDRVAEVLLDPDVPLDVLRELLSEPGLDPRRGARILVSPSGVVGQEVQIPG